MQNKKTAHDRSITRALSYIRSAQEADGSFSSLAFPGIMPGPDAERHFTTFHVSLILGCISYFKNNPSAQAIAARGIDFLLSEKSPAWTWNYWKKSSPEYLSVRCPDDLDDTSAALSAISAWRPELIDEHALLAIINSLIATETDPGGPYNTWIIDDYTGTAWEDTDIAVNSNVAHFLTSQTIALAPLVAYVEKAIQEHALSSRYYSPLAIIYLISKWYRGAHDPELLMLLDKIKSEQGTIECAMWTSARLSLGGKTNKTRKLIDAIMKLQNADGSWSACAVYTEQIIAGVPWKSGSRALSTALCLETFALYDTALIAETKEKEKKVVRKKTLKVQRDAAARLRRCSPLVQRQFSIIIERVARKDVWTEIALLPYFFNASLKNNLRVPEETVDELCVANALGWIGYTIIDKVLDGEDMREFLPVASIALRQMAGIFDMLPLDGHGHELIRRLLDSIDDMNAWEHSVCKLRIEGDLIRLPEKLPAYPGCMLAEKSIGHAIGPIAIMLAKRIPSGRTDALLVRKFFEHYLTARQLDDDAHDWLEDLKNGFLNSVSVKIIADMPKKMETFDVSSQTEFLQSIFWKKTIESVTGEMTSHIRSARSLLKKMHFLADASYLESLLLPIEHSALKAIAERDGTLRFLAAYDASAPENGA